MFQLKNASFFFLSVCLFLLKEFLLYEKVPKMKTVLYISRKTVIYSQREIRAEELQSLKEVKHWLLLWSPWFVISEPQTKKHCAWKVAIGLEEHSVTLGLSRMQSV